MCIWLWPHTTHQDGVPRGWCVSRNRDRGGGRPHHVSRLRYDIGRGCRAEQRPGSSTATATVTLEVFDVLDVLDAVEDLGGVVRLWTVVPPAVAQGANSTDLDRPSSRCQEQTSSSRALSNARSDRRKPSLPTVRPHLDRRRTESSDDDDAKQYG